jgi:hypothetical protein
LSFREGYSDKISFAGLLISIAILIMLLWVNSASTFDLKEFTRFGQDFVKAAPDVGIATSKYLWNFRTLDLIIQAILVFAAAASCIAMLRPAKESHRA